MMPGNDPDKRKHMQPQQIQQIQQIQQQQQQQAQFDIAYEDLQLIMPRVPKQWHAQVPPGKRRKLIENIKTRLVPAKIPEGKSNDDSRLQSIVDYAVKIEGAMYEKSNSQEEYFHAAAENTYKLTRCLADRRKA